MDMFSSMNAFDAVVKHSGFAPAARHLGLSTSSVARQVDALEKYIGAVLLNRSSQGTTLTVAGEAYHFYAAQILSNLQEAQRRVSDMVGEPKGMLRMSLPFAFAELRIAPIIPDFLARYPEVKLDLVLTDAMVNLAEEQIDVAIRIGGMDNRNLISRDLAPHRCLLCASPGYLAKHLAPVTPADLHRHSCLIFTQSPGGRAWRFTRNEEEETVSVSGQIRVNNLLVLRCTVLQDQGIALMPTWLVGDDIKNGHLVALLTDWTFKPIKSGSAIQVLFPANRRTSQTVRAFIDFVSERFGSPPYWDRNDG